ncbi:MAG TPA: hypothetical protein VJ302_27240, partial [Blastocatellia bacterium]|nr:hypothetical protein [Blastocatellia bacterium]
MLELNQTSSLLLERIAAKISKVGDEAPDWMMATLISPHLAVTQAESFLLRGNATSGLRLNFDARRDLPLEIGASLAEIDAQRYFAVLRLQPNFSIPLPQLIFGNEDPPSGAAWHSLIITSSTPKGLPVSGTVAGIREIDGDRYLELLSSQPLEPHAIGAPVVVGDRLVGILNQPVNDRQWRAIPVSSLLESQKTELVYETWLYQRLSVSSRRALSHADGIRRALGLEEVRMEHLIAGSFEKKSGAMRRVLTGQGIDGNRLNQMLAEISQRDFPAQGQYTATNLSALPPISPQVRQALRKA